MDHALHVIDRGTVFEAARCALALQQRLTASDFDHGGDPGGRGTSGRGGGGGDAIARYGAGPAQLPRSRRGAPAVRVARVRHWTRPRLLRVPVPLADGAALRPEVPWAPAVWMPRFLANEAEESLALLQEMERAWSRARQAVADRRRTLQATAADQLFLRPAR